MTKLTIKITDEDAQALEAITGTTDQLPAEFAAGIIGAYLDEFKNFKNVLIVGLTKPRLKALDHLMQTDGDLGSWTYQQALRFAIDKKLCLIDEPPSTGAGAEGGGPGSDNGGPKDDDAKAWADAAARIIKEIVDLKELDDNLKGMVQMVQAAIGSKEDNQVRRDLREREVKALEGICKGINEINDIIRLNTDAEAPFHIIEDGK